LQKIVFILGGSRSGKSTYALEQASTVSGEKAFIATAEILDEEMRVRIQKHKKERGKDWDTYEEPLYIASLIESLKNRYDVVLIDCLTLWLSNIMHAGLDVEDEVKRFASTISDNCPALLYIVSNEVGLGIVPESPLGRKYRDNLGFLNRRTASVATDVYFMVAGIPLKVKGELRNMERGVKNLNAIPLNTER
jgi:adenosylcobinamide kinase/adenosylcobinamide-phosphate guanylyltransferase